MHHIGKLTIVGGLAGMLSAFACGEAPSNGTTGEGTTELTRLAETNGAQTRAQATDQNEESEACSVDADCDSDEVCTAGLCSDTDGEEADDGDDQEDDEACTVDTDCDSDEVCTAGLCSDADGEDDDDDEGHGGQVCGDGGHDDEADDDEADEDEACTVDADCDSDEVCTAGFCSDADGEEADDEEDDADDVCTVDSDCDADEACLDGTCEDR